MATSSLRARTFHPTGIDELDIPDLSRFCFQYTILELNTAVKPYFLSHLLDTYGFKKLILTPDPDTIITENLSDISRLLSNQHSIILTPHLTAQIDDDYKPSELDSPASRILQPRLPRHWCDSGYSNLPEVVAGAAVRQLPDRLRQKDVVDRRWMISSPGCSMACTFSGSRSTTLRTGTSTVDRLSSAMAD